MHLCAAIVAMCVGPLTAPLPPAQQQPVAAATVIVHLDRPLARFSPRLALGGALDGHSEGETAQIYTRVNERAMAAAGLGAVTYRLRTELGVKAWHYAPGGSWSNGAHREGYWTGPAAARAGRRAPRVSWGYSLPRRGDTVDQANDSGFSRLDDGSLKSFWKSNPYLDSHYTSEAEGRHAQWVLIDLGRARPVDALRVAWYAPYARRFAVQWWVGRDAVMLAGNPPGYWRTFPYASLAGHTSAPPGHGGVSGHGGVPPGHGGVSEHGGVLTGHGVSEHGGVLAGGDVLAGLGGVQTVRLARKPLRVRFVRLLLLASSHTLPRGMRSNDVRDRLGYALRELYLGGLGRDGRLHDLLRHRASSRQSVVYVSSTDPWHRASERDPGYEQPSFQTVLHSGLTRGEPLLVPVSLLYGTPQSAVAELRYLQTLGVPLRGVELGEEPDGQLSSPEDYGALYVRWARAIHASFPKLALGGPGFQTSIPDWVYWPDAHGERSWTARFVAYLRARGTLGLLSFFSFEWYPYDNVCADPAGQLAQASELLSNVLALQRQHGLSARLPVYVTEYGYSAFAGQDEVDLPGALLNADTVGTLLKDGASAAYLYGYEPDAIMRESESCDTWGNLLLLQSDEEHRVRHRLATYWETWMLTHAWTQPGNGVHTLYAADSSAMDGAGHELVRAYAVRRPDGRLAVLLLNMSPSQPYQVTLRAAGTGALLSGRLIEWGLSAAQYRWQADGPAGRPSHSLPPARVAVEADDLRLPPYSITVVRMP
jgi:hypothetical protein